MKKLLLLALFIGCIYSMNYAQTQLYYLGTGKPGDAQGTSCASCHTTGNIGPAIYDEWKNTRHATAYDSSRSNFFGFNCLQCHTTGWNPGEANYGADEYVSFDSTRTPNYVITDSTNWNRVKNVGCEACHGPTGSEGRVLSLTHWSESYKPSYSADVCAPCHQGSHDPFFENWSSSGHANAGLGLPFIANNPECQRCHVGQNFVKYISDPANYRDTILVTGTEKQPITCQTCHDPHNAQYEAQLRFPISNTATICDQCHTSEIDSVDINVEPHHATSEALSGSANFGYRYPGETYINSGHTYAALKRCVNCHVFPSAFANGVANTGHTFQPRVEACRSCHSDYYTVVDTGNVAKRFDYRGVQTQIDSLIAALENKLSHASSADSQTIAFKEANYNYLSVEAEGSRGIHNTRLVRKLLLDALGRFNPTAVEQEIGLPSTYTISQNYPNPFNPSTSIKFSLPKAGNVRITVYDAIGKEVEVLVNDYYNQGNYKVDWNASHYSSGIYLYKIEVNDFSSVKKMVLIK